MSRSAPAAVGLTVAAGSLLAVQARVNGALGLKSGVILAALASYASGTVLLALMVGGSRSLRSRVGRQMLRRMRWWWYAGGVGGAAVVAFSAAGVPLVGVSAVAIALVTGATFGGFLVDATGLGPQRARPITRGRVLGAGLALAAVFVSGSPQRLDRGSVVIMLCVVGAGVLSAGQQAASGHVQHLTGDARLAALTAFAGATLILGVAAAALAVSGRLPSPRWPPEPVLYLGGVVGTAYGMWSAIAVNRVGVLSVTLATVSGQLLGALILDLLIPLPGLRISVLSIVSVGLSLLGAVVGGFSRLARPQA